ncbi:hypothetical protein KCP77_15080 [Salmonella enterica subsp. enterica]|nr:hypothetical protein KCP77_15080 [Salmonella enterica subsp. enterica]
MATVCFRQWGRPVRRQNVNGAAAIVLSPNMSAFNEAPDDSGDALPGNMRGVTFAGMSISPFWLRPHGVAVLNAARLRINRVDQISCGHACCRTSILP